MTPPRRPIAVTSIPFVNRVTNRRSDRWIETRWDMALSVAMPGQSPGAFGVSVTWLPGRECRETAEEAYVAREWLRENPDLERRNYLVPPVSTTDDTPVIVGVPQARDAIGSTLQTGTPPSWWMMIARGITGIEDSTPSTTTSETPKKIELTVIESSIPSAIGHDSRSRSGNPLAGADPRRSWLCHSPRIVVELPRRIRVNPFTVVPRPASIRSLIRDRAAQGAHGRDGRRTTHGSGRPGPQMTREWGRRS